MKSKLLLERLPEITGNIIITVKLDGSVFLNIIGTNQALSISQLFNFPVNTTLGLVNDYSNYLRRNAYRNLNDPIDLSQNVEYLKNHIQTSLLIGDKIPDFFIICKKISDDLPVKLLQYYDLSEKTVIGKYLNDFKKEFSGSNPITINTNKKEIHITGINLTTGIINKFQIIYDSNDDINQKILTYIRENKILIPNIVNIEFESEFVDEDISYYYTDRVDLFKYDISKVGGDLFLNNKDLFLRSSCLVENNHIDTDEDIPMSFIGDNFFLPYMDNGEKIFGLRNEDVCLKLEEDVKLSSINVSQINLKKVYNPVSYSKFKYIGGITQSVFVDVFSNNYHIQLISDYMPNLIQAGIPFLPTDNNYYVFNWIGTLAETMISFSKAWNQSSSETTKITCIPEADTITFINEFGGAFDININNNKINKISSFSENVLNFSYFKIENFEEVSNISKNHYLFVGRNVYDVVDVVDNIYLDNSTGKIMNDGKLLVLRGVISQEDIEGTVVLFDNPTIGVMDVMDNVLCKRTFKSNSKNILDLSNFFKPDDIRNGVTYKVVSNETIILYDGVEYGTGETFVGADEKIFTINKGLGNICEVEFSDDAEITPLFNTEILDNELLTDKIAFSQNYNSDFEGQIPNLITRNVPRDNIFVVDANNRTNEWLIPTKYPYIEERYELSGIDIEGDNYSEKLLGKFATEFEKNGSIYKTTFRGAEIMSTDNLEGYKFMGILNVHDEDGYGNGIRTRLIKNKVDKYLLYIVDIPISDYRFINRFNFCITYNAKNSKESGISQHIFYDFGDIRFTGIRIKCLVINMVENKIMFNQKILIKLLITESNDGVALVFRSLDGGTVISNYGYLTGIDIVRENTVYDIVLSENNAVLSGEYMYVSKINGVPYNVSMHYTELATLIDFGSLECFQIGNFENDLENLFSLINFSNLKENINLNKTFIEKYVVEEDGSLIEDESVNINVFQPETCNSGQYNIPIETKESHLGSTTPNILGVYGYPWSGQDHTWLEDENSINILDKYFNKKLNLIQ